MQNSSLTSLTLSHQDLSEMRELSDGNRMPA